MAREVAPTEEVVETTETTETTETEIQDQKLVKFEDLIASYLQETGELPFVDIQLREEDDENFADGNLMVDMKDDFHEEALKTFGGDLDALLGEYVTSLITNAIKTMTDEEMKAMADEYKDGQDGQDQQTTLETENEKGDAECANDGKCC